MATPDTLMMMTSEIAVAELNTLRDDIVFIIPKELCVTDTDEQDDGSTVIYVVRRETNG